MDESIFWQDFFIVLFYKFFNYLHISRLLFCFQSPFYGTHLVLHCIWLLGCPMDFFKVFYIFFRNSIVAANFDSRKFPFTNPIPYSNDFYAIPLCNISASVHFRQNYPSFFLYFYTCVYLGLVIYYVYQTNYII